MNIGVISLGCPRAVADFEASLGSLSAVSGRCRVVTNKNQAEILIINTCGFIEAAKKESLGAIFEAVALKKNGRARAVIVMGCLSQRYGRALRDQIPEIDAVIGVDDYDRLAGIIKSVDRGGKLLSARHNPRYLPDSSRHLRASLGSEHTAYIKISEGCLNRCAYCAIPLIRGGHRFRSQDSICREIGMLKRRRGLSEAVLVGQDTAAYGFDRAKHFKLAGLLRKIAHRTGVGWIRILYAHPAHVTDELIETIATTAPVCKYIDLPIEHCNDGILSKMNRRITRRQIEGLVERLRRRIPSIAIRTSVMVGFPSETSRQFADLLAFIKTMRFDRLGVFEYSREEGTAAYSMRSQISAAVKKTRYDSLMRAQMEISKERNKTFLGQTLRVLVDAPCKSGRYEGRTEYDAPEIDPKVIFRSAAALRPGDFVTVRIARTGVYDLYGETA